MKFLVLGAMYFIFALKTTISHLLYSIILLFPYLYQDGHANVFCKPLNKCRLLYAQNRCASNKQIWLTYKVDLNTQTFSGIPLCNGSLPQHLEASLGNPCASTFPASTVPTLQLSPFTNTSSPYTSHTPPSIHPPSPSHHHIFLNLALNHAHHWFCERTNGLSPLHVCSIWKASYPNMKTKFLHGNLYCSWCATAKSTHHFSLANNMDPGNQPFILATLTQIEEMLMSRISPVLQVTYAQGGQ